MAWYESLFHIPDWTFKSIPFFPTVGMLGLLQKKKLTLVPHVNPKSVIIFITSDFSSQINNS